MNKLFLITAFCILTGCISKDRAVKHTDPGYDLFPVLRMKIVPTIDHPEIYEVYRHQKVLRVMTYKGSGGYDWKAISSSRQIELTDHENNEILRLLDRALDFPKNDNSLGPDGETWMLESSLYQYTAVSFWEPTYQVSQRGLSDLVELKKYLGKLKNSAL